MAGIRSDCSFIDNLPTGAEGIPELNKRQLKLSVLLS